MTNYYNENVSSSVKPKIKVKGLNDLNAQVTMISDVDYEMSLDSNDDLVYKDNDAWVLSNLSDFSVRNEQYKTHLQGMKIISTNKFDISKTWRISGLYPRVNIDHKFGKMVRFSDINSESRNEQNIEFTTTVEIPSQTISIEEKEEFNKFIALLKRESRLRVFGTKVE